MTSELGHLVNDLVNAAHKCGAGEDSTSGEQYQVLWSAQVAAEKALLEYVEKRERELAKLREGVEKAVIKWNQEAFQTRPVRRGMEVAHFHAHADALTACAAELRALLK